MVKRKFSAVRKRKAIRALTRNLKRQKITRRRVWGRISPTNVHKYVRWASGETLSFVPTVTNPTNELDFAKVFQLDMVKNYSEFTALYDRYKITGVKVMVQLITNPDANNIVLNGSVSNPNNIYPKVWWCPDYDDGSATTLDALKERAQTKCRVLRPNSTISFFIKPAVLAQTYRTAVTTGYAPKWNQYIDIGQTDVPHYGFKMVVESLGQNIYNLSNVAFYVRLEYKYYLTLKDVR